MARIKYNGPKNVKRVIGNLVWSKANNHIVDVNDTQTVKLLLEQPNGEFTLAEAEKPAASTKTKS